MKALCLALVSLALFSTLTFAQTEERNIDFTLSPALILDKKIQVAFEWLDPAHFKMKHLGVVDLPKISEQNANKNQMIAAKIAFISNNSFDDLSHSKMNNKTFISEMLSSIGISQKTSDIWRVTNRVKAYGLPFKVSFDFNFKEVASKTLGNQVVKYLSDEASGLKGTGKERFMTLDMTNFSQLIYRNYAIVYMKEISPKETLIVSVIITGFDLSAANSYFNLPPFSTTKSTMMGNFKTQIFNMARSIQK
jgi:hypothetical protein